MIKMNAATRTRENGRMASFINSHRKGIVETTIGLATLAMVSSVLLAPDLLLPTLAELQTRYDTYRKREQGIADCVNNKIPNLNADPAFIRSFRFNHREGGSSNVAKALRGCEEDYNE